MCQAHHRRPLQRSGKTAILLDTIINSRGRDLICIYCAIGQEALLGRADRQGTLEEHGALDYTIGVAAIGF